MNAPGSGWYCAGVWRDIGWVSEPRRWLSTCARDRPTCVRTREAWFAAVHGSCAIGECSAESSAWCTATWSTTEDFADATWWCSSDEQQCAEYQDPMEGTAHRTRCIRLP